MRIGIILFVMIFKVYPTKIERFFGLALSYGKNSGDKVQVFIIWHSFKDAFRVFFAILIKHLQIRKTLPNSDFRKLPDEESVERENKNKVLVQRDNTWLRNAERSKWDGELASGNVAGG